MPQHVVQAGVLRPVPQKLQASVIALREAKSDLGQHGGRSTKSRGPHDKTRIVVILDL